MGLESERGIGGGVIKRESKGGGRGGKAKEGEERERDRKRG